MTKQQDNIKLHAVITAFREYNDRNNTPFAILVFYDDLSGRIEDDYNNAIVSFQSLDQLITLLAE